MTVLQLRTNIRVNLNDNGITFYSDQDINDSIQDAYNEIAARTKFLTKTAANLSWQANSNYYDFLSLGVTDYLGTIGIFNNVSNLWLRDDISIKQFDNIRRDWELWIGSPQFWAPHSFKYTAIAPKYAVANAGTYNLLYNASAPILSGDTDSPLIAADMQVLIELYATADLLESADEPTKAITFWNQYTPKLEIYKQRSGNAAKSDLLMRI